MKQTASPEEKLASFLYGANDTPSVYLDRLLIRFMHYPAYVSAMEAAAVNEANDIELVFTPIPPETIKDVHAIIGRREKVDVIPFKNEHGQPRIGFRIRPTGLADEG